MNKHEAAWLHLLIMSSRYRRMSESMQHDKWWPSFKEYPNFGSREKNEEIISSNCLPHHKRASSFPNKHKAARLHLLPKLSRYIQISESEQHNDQRSSLHDRWCLLYDEQCPSLHTEGLKVAHTNPVKHFVNPKRNHEPQFGHPSSMQSLPVQIICNSREPSAQMYKALSLLEVCSLQSRAINTYSGLVSYKYTGQYDDTHPPDCTMLQHKRHTKPKFFIKITYKSEGLTVMVLRTEVFRDVTPCSWWNGLGRDILENFCASIFWEKQAKKKS